MKREILDYLLIPMADADLFFTHTKQPNTQNIEVFNNFIF